MPHIQPLHSSPLSDSQNYSSSEMRMRRKSSHKKYAVDSCGFPQLLIHNSSLGYFLSPSLSPPAFQPHVPHYAHSASAELARRLYHILHFPTSMPLPMAGLPSVLHGFQGSASFTKTSGIPRVLQIPKDRICTI